MTRGMERNWSWGRTFKNRMMNTTRAPANPTTAPEAMGTQRTERYPTSPNHSYSVYQPAREGKMQRPVTSTTSAFRRSLPDQGLMVDYS